jgi:hypothetical protein
MMTSSSSVRRSKPEGFGDEARVASAGGVECVSVLESERVHGLVRRLRA